MNVVFVGGDAPTLESVTQGIQIHWPLASITAAASGAVVLEMVEEATPDVVLVHTELRDMFAQVLVEELRGVSSTPILVLTRDPDGTEAVTTLDSGADDYFQFPCGMWELIARIWAALRRAGLIAFRDENRCLLISGRLFIDPVTYEVFLDGQKVHLTPAEFRLLYLLAQNHGDVVSHQALEKELRGDQRLNIPSTKSYIRRLRWKLEDSASTPRWIASVYGVGYRFVGPRPLWHPASGGFLCN